MSDVTNRIVFEAGDGWLCSVHTNGSFPFPHLVPITHKNRPLGEWTTAFRISFPPCQVKCFPRGRNKSSECV